MLILLDIINKCTILILSFLVYNDKTSVSEKAKEIHSNQLYLINGLAKSWSLHTPDLFIKG